MARTTFGARRALVPGAPRPYTGRSFWLAGLVAVLAGCASTPKTPAIVTDTAARHIPGKFVWHALFTFDVPGAHNFYGELLGWKFEALDGKGDYSAIKFNGKTIGAIVGVKPVTDGVKHSTQWISFLSVDNVDVGAALAKSEGKVYREPLEMPGLGRVALIADPLGAPLALLRSASGDPADGVEPRVGEFLWREYVSQDPEKAWTFYRRLVSWETRKEPTSPGVDYWSVVSGGKPRAGAFRSPWAGVQPNWLPYVRVEDPVALSNRAKSLGGTIVLATHSDVRNGTTAIVTDPQGGAIALQKYPY